MDNNCNPINETSLEHGLLFCRKLKEEGKTLDDLIEHLTKQLKIIKFKKFNEIEQQVYK